MRGRKTTSQRQNFLAPTIVLDQAPFDHEESTPSRTKKKMKKGSDNKREVSSALVSYPRKGKHIAFSGNLLHGIPVEFAVRDGKASRKTKMSDEPRVTFLANLWLNCLPPQNIPTFAQFQHLHRQEVKKEVSSRSANEGAITSVVGTKAAASSPPLDLVAKKNPDERNITALLASRPFASRLGESSTTSSTTLHLQAKDVEDVAGFSFSHLRKASKNAKDEDFVLWLPLPKKKILREVESSLQIKFNGDMDDGLSSDDEEEEDDRCFVERQ
ncbi:unnamed protein product [Amoebophrya sp. A25]|nr:unnamed protein product [Amoebophrya sp. A25]|eukprot:GSA25T00009032001.1